MQKGGTDMGWLTTSFPETVPILVLKVPSSGKPLNTKKTGTGGHPVVEK